MRNDIKFAFLIAILFSLSACGEQAAVSEASPSSQEMPESELSLRDYMVHVLQHNAVEFWDWTSHEIDQDGYKIVKPQNEEQWEEAEGAALTLMELTALLYMPPLGRDDPEWLAGVEKLHGVAKEAAAAALAKDYEAFVAASDRMDVACVSCHYVFAPQIEDPALKDFYLRQQEEL